MDKYCAEDIVYNWMYKEEKYTEKEYHLVEDAIKYRVKNKLMNYWEPMFYYFSRNNFKLSLLYAHKFYNNSVKKHNFSAKSSACNWLGDHYLYGFGTVKDYKKAYIYYMEALEIDKNDPYALYDLAIMYKNGYYVKRDIDKYHEIITKLFNRENYFNSDENDSFESIGSEIYQHYAYCLIDKGGKTNIEKAKKYLKKSREEIVKFLYFNDWDGSAKQLSELDDNIVILNNLIKEIDNSQIQHYISIGKKSKSKRICDIISSETKNCIDYGKVDGDIYTLIRLPRTNKEYQVKFSYNNNIYTIFAKKYDNNKMYYNFLNKNYRNMEEFIRNANIGNTEIRQLINDIKSIYIIM